MKIDLHTHPRPESGFLEKLIVRCIETKIIILGITDFEDERYNYFLNYAKENLPRKDYGVFKRGRSFEVFTTKGQIKFIRSQEIPTADGHLLTVGAKEKIPSGLSLEETIREAKKDRTTMIIADHPYVPQNVWGGMGEENLIRYREHFDAIEWNAQCIDLFPFPKFLKQAGANKKAEEFSERYGLALIADSDAHFSKLLFLSGSLEQIGLSYIALPFYRCRNDDDYIDCLKNQIANHQHTNIQNSISRFGFLRWCIPLYITGKNKHK